MRGVTRLTFNGVDLTAQVAYVSLHTSLPEVDVAEVSGHGYARIRPADTDSPDSPDAMRLDASRAEADAELAEWRALLDAAKGRTARTPESATETAT